MDAQTRAWIDQQAAGLKMRIRRHGWALQYVAGGACSHPGCDCSADDGRWRSEEWQGPPFAYTIGLFGMGHPELLIFGVDPGTASGVLNTLGERIRSGESLLPGQLITFEEWPHRIIPEEVPNPGDIVLGANDFYRRPPRHSVPVLQLSYDDPEGNFPWDDGYVAPDRQPRPGTFHA